MKFTNIIKSVVVVFITTTAVASTAMAQTKVLVVDRNKIMRDSKAGKHLDKQILAIGKQMETELKALKSPLESKAKTFQTETQNMSEAALKSRPDLEQRFKGILVGQQKLENETKIKMEEGRRTRIKAENKINAKLEVILQSIIKERNADIVLERRQVMYAGPKIDITNIMITRLDAQMPTVTVIRERLPRQAPKKK